MKHLTFRKYSRYGLYTQLVDFALEEGTVHHLVTDIRIQQSKDVEGLHHIRTVGTGKRYIGLQADVTLQGTDTSGYPLIRQVLSLAIGIQYGQQERCKLVSVRNTPEGNARFFTVLQQCEGQGIAISFMDFDLEMR